MLPARDLLDRDHLHVFVTGPGRGEGLALALPRPALGWIFVDGCKTPAGAFPLHEIWNRYRLDDDPVIGILLTHPHDDHVEGMLDLIDLSSPRWLACVATHHRDGGVLRAEVIGRRDEPLLEEHPELELVLRRVKDLLARVQNEWNLGRCGRVALRAGGGLPLDRADLSIQVVAPDPDGTRKFFAESKLPERIRTRANEVSAVLHVRFGEARVVLGGDLPELDHGAGPRTGWTRVLSDYPDLPGSALLKVPHHGSDGAMHPRMVGPGVAPAGAIWALTPFQGGDRRPVPKLRHGKGVEALLRGAPSVYLTALPSGWSAPMPRDAPVPISALRSPEERLTIDTGAPLRLPALPRSFPRHPVGCPPCTPLDPVWLFAIDRRGRCIARYRGASALEITREPRAPGGSDQGLGPPLG